MKAAFALLPLLLIGLLSSHADTFLDEEIFGDHLGGWTEKGEKAAAYEISGSKYRTWKPTATPTPDGGTFVSVRIDHMRGLFASDDHASLEVTINDQGDIISASSSIAIQGKKITSDLIRGAGEATSQISGVTRAAKIGTDLVANLTSKLFREKVTEPGRVTFPAAVQHNYNLLCQALWDKKKEITQEPTTPSPTNNDLSPSNEQEASQTAQSNDPQVNITQAETTPTEQQKRKATPLKVKPTGKPHPVKK